jgi:hypothetical protein
VSELRDDLGGHNGVSLERHVELIKVKIWSL